MNNKELRLIKEEFCRLNNLAPGTEATLEYQGREPVSGDPLFMVYPSVGDSVLYQHERIDLRPYTEHRSLDLDKELRLNRTLINRDMIADWFSRVTGIIMLPGDVGQLLVRDEVTLVASSNSMRFKHTFSMVFS